MELSIYTENVPAYSQGSGFQCKTCLREDIQTQCATIEGFKVLQEEKPLSKWLSLKKLIIYFPVSTTMIVPTLIMSVWRLFVAEHQVSGVLKTLCKERSGDVYPIVRDVVKGIRKVSRSLNGIGVFTCFSIVLLNQFSLRSLFIESIFKIVRTVAPLLGLIISTIFVALDLALIHQGVLRYLKGQTLLKSMKALESSKELKTLTNRVEESLTNLEREIESRMASLAISLLLLTATVILIIGMTPLTPYIIISFAALSLIILAYESRETIFEKLLGGGDRKLIEKRLPQEG